jgi:hypothetical protein
MPADKGSPFGQFQYVTVTFPSTPDTDLVIPHDLTTEATERIKWLVVSIGFPSTPSPYIIYEDTSTTRRAWGKRNIILRCNQPSVKVTLLLVVSV